MNLPLVVLLERNSTPTPTPGEPREHRVGEVLQGRSKTKFNIILSFFSLNLPLVFIFVWLFDKFHNQLPGEPREHHLG